jgi:hypothetical protein
MPPLMMNLAMLGHLRYVLPHLNSSLRFPLPKGEEYGSSQREFTLMAIHVCSVFFSKLPPVSWGAL